jgi:hypothetical protein
VIDGPVSESIKPLGPPGGDPDDRVDLVEQALLEEART